MAYVYFGNTSTRKQETFTSHGSDGAEAMLMGFGSSDFHPNKTKPWPFPPFPNPKDTGNKQPKFNPDNYEDAPI